MTTEKLMTSTEANTVMREFLKMVIDNTFENLDEAVRDPETYAVERVRIPVFVAWSDHAESIHANLDDAKAAMGGVDAWEQYENTRGDTVWRRKGLEGHFELIKLDILELELKVFNDRQKIHADARIARLQHDLALALARRTGAGVRWSLEHPTRITVADYVQHGFWKKGKRGECRVYWDSFIVNDISGNAESGYSVNYGATGLAVVDASTHLIVVWLDEVVAAPPAAPPPADSEDRQLATIARGIAETLEVCESDGYISLPISVNTDGESRYETAFTKSIRQLALWKAGQQVAEAGEAALVDALAEARERIAELEAERDSAVREGEEKASSPLYDKYESVPNLASQIGQFFDEAGGVNYVEIEMIAQDGRTFTLNIQRNEGKTPHQIITELKAEVRLLQEERDSAVREANKRAFLLREIEALVDPKNRIDGEVLAHTLNTIHAKIVRATASTSVPESEATDA